MTLSPSARKVGWSIVALALLIVGAVSIMLIGTPRPQLLQGAEWNNAKSAHRFNERFTSGTPTVELTTWLAANDFQSNLLTRQAHWTGGQLPCGETIDVLWTEGGDRRLKSAEAIVNEAGCL